MATNPLASTVGRLALAGILLAGATCSRGDDPAPAAAPTLAAVDLAPPAGSGASEASLAAAGDDLALSWLEEGPDAGARSLRFSRFASGRWSAPVTIAAGDLLTNASDTPTLTAAGDDLFAAWPERRAGAHHASDVATARSDDGGATWRRLGRPYRDTTPAEHGFVSLVGDAAGGLDVFWLDGRERAAAKQAGDRDLGALTLRTARLGADGFTPDRLLDDRVCDCCWTAAAATATGQVVVYRDRSPEEIRDIRALRLAADGTAESRLVHRDGWRLFGCPVNGPAVAARGDEVVVAWLTGAGDTPRVRAAFSADGGASFGPPIELAAGGTVGRVGVVSTAAGQAIVSWIGRTSDGAAIELATIDRTGGRGAPRVLAPTTAARSSGIPRLALHGDRLAVAWAEGTGATGRRLHVSEIPLADLPAPSSG